MPAPASIEDAPHHLKLLNDYGKGVVTLALGLLTLSVTFSEKLLKSPGDEAQAALLAALWLALLVAIVSGLFTVGHVNAVSYFYMKALRVGYPDALELLGKGEKVKPDDPTREIQVTDPAQQGEINKALERAGGRARYAYNWARRSLIALGASAVLIFMLGGYAGIYRASHADPATAVDAARAFVAGPYGVAAGSTQLKSLTFDDKANAYAVEIGNRHAAGEEYRITVGAGSGRVTHAARSP